ncbi:hypothetical protein GIB67_041683 [Kingdonia uniflora]|uniref:Probable magnesium transporter n=1 Tax=Kingdonia uniflora TaxID=39325 RepID=A0A7J7MR19_9MAGN|nr:hypothetical protein GIB67_041683 [Kingdonia uniflora]
MERKEANGCSLALTKVLRAYAFNKAWIVGFLMDIFGALLMLRALSLAPVSVIQPVSGCGLAILCIFSHFHLKEVMNAIDWLGIALAGVGTIGVGVGGEEQKASAISISHLPWLIFIVAILFVGGLYASMWRTLDSEAVYCQFRCEFWQVKPCLMDGFVSTDVREESKSWLVILSTLINKNEIVQFRYWMQSEVVEEIIYGLESGILFGMASVISKMGFVFLEQGFSQMLVPLCISISICCSGTGFVYQTRGLKHGRAIVVSTCAAVASIVTGVLAGMLALGEQLPSAPFARLWLFLGWLFIIVGVILLVSSTRLTKYLPRPFRHLTRGNLERTNSLRRSGSVRPRDSDPSTIIHATTLHHLITSPTKEKP